MTWYAKYTHRRNDNYLFDQHGYMFPLHLFYLVTVWGLRSIRVIELTPWVP